MTFDPQAHRLPPEESARRFHEQIVPQRLAHGVPQDRPRLVVVAGQSGAGKTAVEQRVHTDLGGGTVIIDADDMRTHHPDYVALAMRNDRLASAACHPDASRWVHMAMEYCVANRYNVVLSTTLRTAGGTKQIIDRFKGARYPVEVAALAVHEATSRLSVLRRYQRGREDVGFGRYVPSAFQSDAYAGLPSSLDHIDTGRLADAVHVYRRDGRQLYSNELGKNGEWVRPPAARAALEAGRALPWGAAEIHTFREQAEYLRARLPEDLRDDLLIAVRAARNHIAATGTAATPAEVAQAARLAAGRTAPGPAPHGHRHRAAPTDPQRHHTARRSPRRPDPGQSR